MAETAGTSIGGEQSSAPAPLSGEQRSEPTRFASDDRARAKTPGKGQGELPAWLRRIIWYKKVHGAERGYVPLRPWWWVCRTAAFIPAWLLLKSHVVHIKRVPRRGGVILACNHQSFLDPVLATVSLPRESAYMARDTLFTNKWFGWLIQSVNAIPVRRGQADMTSIKEMLRRLRDNFVVVIFPEETRSPDGRIGPMKPGAVVIARKAKAAIVPVCVDGAFEAWPRDRLLPGPGWATVAYGEPITVEQMKGRSDEDVLAEVRRRIIALQHELRRRRGVKTYEYDE